MPPTRTGERVFHPLFGERGWECTTGSFGVGHDISSTYPTRTTGVWKFCLGGGILRFQEVMVRFRAQQRPTPLGHRDSPRRGGDALHFSPTLSTPMFTSPPPHNSRGLLCTVCHGGEGEGSPSPPPGMCMFAHLTPPITCATQCRALAGGEGEATNDRGGNSLLCEPNHCEFLSF